MPQEHSRHTSGMVMRVAYLVAFGKDLVKMKKARGSAPPFLGKRKTPGPQGARGISRGSMLAGRCMPFLAAQIRPFYFGMVMQFGA